MSVFTQVNLMVVFVERFPLWFRRLVESTRTMQPYAKAPARTPSPMSADTLHIVSGRPVWTPAGWRWGRLVVETDVDGVDELSVRNYDELLLHVDSYDTARAYAGFASGRLRFVYYVDTSNLEGFVQSVEELLKLSVLKVPLVVEVDKWGEARLNYVASLMVYKLGGYVRDVSFYNIAAYLEGDNITYSEYAYPPFQLTVIGGRVYGCPHGALYWGDTDLSTRPLFTYENYKPCPAMLPRSDPYLFLMGRVYGSVDVEAMMARAAEVLGKYGKKIPVLQAKLAQLGLHSGDEDNVSDDGQHEQLVEDSGDVSSSEPSVKQG